MTGHGHVDHGGDNKRVALLIAILALCLALAETGAKSAQTEALSRNVKGLVKVTDVLVKRRAELDETLSAAPVALANLFHTYNPSTGTLDTRSNFSYNEDLLLSDPALVLCELIGGADQNDAACNQLKDALGSPAGRAAVGARLGGPEAQNASSSPSRDVVEVEPIDTTLAGILGEEAR